MTLLRFITKFSISITYDDTPIETDQPHQTLKTNALPDCSSETKRGADNSTTTISRLSRTKNEGCLYPGTNL